jgi:hypothetical protein
MCRKFGAASYRRTRASAVALRIFSEDVKRLRLGHFTASGKMRYSLHDIC